MAEGSTPVGDAIDALRGLFGNFSATGKLPESSKADDRGVEVRYRKSGGSVVRFHFVTSDDLECQVDVDLNRLSRGYIDWLVQKLRHDLAEQRLLEYTKRLPVFIHPPAAA